MLAYKFDTQLLIEGEDLSEDAVTEYITENIEGDCLLAVGDEELIKIHFHTNTPWKVLEYCASLGDIHDVVVYIVIAVLDWHIQIMAYLLILYHGLYKLIVYLLRIAVHNPYPEQPAYLIELI